MRSLQISRAADNQINSSDPNMIMATRVKADAYDAIKLLAQGTVVQDCLQYNAQARILYLSELSGETATTAAKEDRPVVVIACAGTTDIYCAEEVALTLELSKSCDVERVYDVGVAGLHRIINAIPILTQPRVKCIVVCAGMDGALPSVVAGLVDKPVIAVPTSVGYGASFNGVAALLTMLNSCAPGVAVCNIDGGFSAAALAHKIVAGATPAPPSSS
jgi:NCAIR mutase (PurE)-related protein